MKKVMMAVCIGLFTFSVNSTFAQVRKTAPGTLSLPKNKKMAETIYEYKVIDITGKPYDMTSLRGKKVIIVNTASKCGLTPQYKELEELYQTFKDKDLVVIGFPANNFADQEPAEDAEIQVFCERNYGVTFPMMSKISVKGDDMHDLYKFLTQSGAAKGEKVSEVEWNFQKYLIGRDGKVEKVISPKQSPLSEEVISWISEK